ncbi:MAG: DUF4173 domain-containing protein [Dehalococcoidia bacterium]|nr:MAG: DUF4173 domain-containing protein [Dehalococcoidia bacterium]
MVSAARAISPAAAPRAMEDRSLDAFKSVSNASKWRYQSSNSVRSTRAAIVGCATATLLHATPGHRVVENGGRPIRPGVNPSPHQCHVCGTLAGRGGSNEVGVTGFLESAAAPLGDPSQTTSQPSPTLPMSAFAGYIARLIAPPLALSAGQVRLLAGFAALIAVWTDVLFHRTDLGINFPLWIAAIVGLAAFAGRRFGRAIPADRFAVLATAVVLCSVTAWRDSDALKIFGILGTLSLLTVGLGLAPGLAVRRVNPVACVATAIAVGVSFPVAVLRIAIAGQWQTAGRGRTSARILLALRVVALTVPLLVVFGLLFKAADAVFAAQVDRVIDLNFDGVGPHIFWLIFGFVIGAAALMTSVAVTLPEEIEVTLPERHRLGRVEVGIALGLLSMLFALFVAVQIRYLFGGEDAVTSSIDLTYAQYAREGFFQLVVASLLLLPVLAGIDWARRRDVASSRLFLAFAVTLVALLFVIMASAWQRLAIYRDAFGLTEARFYGAATLPWLAVALVWFLVSVARRRMEHFLAGAAFLAVAVLLALYALNPDRFIARTNLSRLDEGREFDAAYASVLSADAIPSLIERLDTLPEAERCTLATAIRERGAEDDGWRSWNWSRSRASRLITTNDNRLACDGSK